MMGAGVVVVLLALAAAVATRLPGRWRVVAYIVVLAVAMQYLLLGNPVAWRLYLEVLSPEEVGWRQYGVMRRRLEHFALPSRHVEFLAVGSSQTDAVYGSYALEHEDLAVFAMAAMAPLDFVLYRSEIAQRRPDHILLYLSDFDIAREQPPEGVAMAPRQGLYLIDLWRTLRSEKTHAYDQAMADLLFGEVSPAYKYRFVFRALADKALRRMARAMGRDEVSTAERASLDQRIEWLREGFGDEYIDFNVSFLREFLAMTAATGSQVVIVEGQYNPLVSNAVTLALKQEVRERLETLCASFEHARFLPAESIFLFSEGDYTDLSHVNSEAGYRFAAGVVSILSDSVP